MKGNCSWSPKEWNTSHWAGHFLCLCFLRQRLVSAMKEFRPDVLLSWPENASKAEWGWSKLDTISLRSCVLVFFETRLFLCLFLLLLSLQFKISWGHLRILSAYLCICDCMNVGIPLQIPVLFLGMQVTCGKLLRVSRIPNIHHEGNGVMRSFARILQVEVFFNQKIRLISGLVYDYD